MNNASYSAQVEIGHVARRRGYIFFSLSGRRKWPWSVTLQAPVDGKATQWHLTASSKASLLRQIEAMPIIPRTEMWQP